MPKRVFYPRVVEMFKLFDDIATVDDFAADVVSNLIRLGVYANDQIRVLLHLESDPDKTMTIKFNKDGSKVTGWVTNE